MNNKKSKLALSMAALALTACFTAASGMAVAQMAAPLQFSPPLAQILMAEPTYGDALKQFNDLVNSPARETLRPADYLIMAQFARQGVADNAVTTPDALGTIVLLHKLCPDVPTRRMISNNAKDVIKFRPGRITDVIAAMKEMAGNETDDSVRAYLESVIKNLEARQVEPAP